MISCAPAKMAAYWFGENERVIAVTVATSAMPIGVAIGYVLPSFFVKAETSSPDYVSQARHEVY